MKVLVAYIPVLHAGYLRLFRTAAASGVTQLWLLGGEILEEFEQLKKDMRALPPVDTASAIMSLGFFTEVCVAVRRADLLEIDATCGAVIMPDEDECHEIAVRYFKQTNVEFASVFLRYDRKKATVENEVVADWEATEDSLHRALMGEAVRLAAKSPDWWRQIGALLVKDCKVLITAYNTTVPTEREALYHGDPRSLFSAGVEIEASLVLHGEAAIVAAAAANGISTRGASLYVTTFPCAPCAKQVAYSGIKEVFFRDGYSRTDGQEVMRARGVRIIRVK